MTRDDDTAENTIQRSRGLGANASTAQSRREPGFSTFDDLAEEGYEEPDRDTSFASGYRADSVEDDDAYDDSPAADGATDYPSDDNSDTRYDADSSLDDDSDDWLMQEAGEQEDGRTWPLGLIAVGVVAMALLAAGGYGVLQQRAAMEEELRDLRAALAVSASGGNAGASRGALTSLQQSYDTLSAQAQALTLENRRLADTVAGLEAQLGAQQSVPTPAAAVPATQRNNATAANVAQVTAADTTAASSRTVVASAAPAPATTAPAAAKAHGADPAAPAPAINEPASKPAVMHATANLSGPWFVNFGTYATRAMADTWASRVRPSAGEVIIAPNDKDGRTLYRVRVVGLSDRDAAQQVARQLESDLRVSQLWVGRE